MNAHQILAGLAALAHNTDMSSANKIEICEQQTEGGFAVKVWGGGSYRTYVRPLLTDALIEAFKDSTPALAATRAANEVADVPYKSVVEGFGLPAPGTSQAQPVVDVKAVLKFTDAQLFAGLLELAGTYHNGSSQPVTLTDDDATREEILRVGDSNNPRRYYGSGHRATITQAIMAHTDALAAARAAGTPQSQPVVDAPTLPKAPMIPFTAAKPAAPDYNDVVKAMNSIKETYGADTAKRLIRKCVENPHRLASVRLMDIKPEKYAKAIDLCKNYNPHVEDVERQLEKAEHERNVLAEAIGEAARKAGIARDDVGLTGPHLILMANDMAECIRAQGDEHAALAALLTVIGTCDTGDLVADAKAAMDQVRDMKLLIAQNQKGGSDAH